MHSTQQKRLGVFFSGFSKISYRKRETIIRPYEVPQGVSYIQKGYIRYYSVSSEGQELTLLIFKPGDFFPVRWGITGQEVRYFYETLTPVDVRRASKDKFITFLKKNPELLLQITQIILIRLRDTYARMEYMAFGGASAKVASILLMLSEQYGKIITQGTLVQVPLTHQDIAALIGVSRETVSLEIEELQRGGILGKKGRLLVIYKPQKLQKLSHFTPERI